MAEEISKLKIGFQLDSSQVEKGLGFVLNNLNLMKKEFKANMVGVDKFNKSLDDLGKESEMLKGILNQQKIALEAIEKEYEKVAKEKGEDSKQAMNLRAKYINMTAEIKKQEMQLARVTEEMQKKQKENEEEAKALAKQNSLQGKLQSALGKTAVAFGKVNTSLNGASKKLVVIGGHLTIATTKFALLGVKAAAAGTAIAVGLGGAAVKNAAELSDSVGNLQIQLGITEEEAKKLQGVAKTLWKDGWGDLPEITNNMAIIKQQMKELSDKELADVTKATMLMNKQFGTDTNEVTRTIDTMMKNLGVSSTEATDILIAGFQGGLNSTGEWLDTMREYSPQFAEMGISGQQAFNMIKSASDAGSWSIDKIGDLIKEGHIRMQDMSDASILAYKGMGLNADEYSKRIAKGGTDGAKALQEVFVKLEGVKSETKRNEIATALFGSQYEDVRENIMWAMSDGLASTEKLGKVTQDATKIAEQSFGQKWAGSMATLKESFEPLGIVLLDLLEKHLPDIQLAIGNLATKIKEIDWQKFIDKAIEIKDTILPPLKTAFENVRNIIQNMDEKTKSNIATFGILAVILGPVIAVIGALGTIVTTAFTVFGKLWNIGKLLVTIFMKMSPLGRVLSIVFALITAGGTFLVKNWETIKKGAQELWTKLSTIFRNLKNAIVGAFSEAWTKISEFFGGIGKWFSDKWTSVITGIGTFVTDMGKAIGDVIDAITGPFEDIDLVKIGEDIINGVIEGIDNAWEWLKEKVDWVAELVPNWLKKALGIKSPLILAA